MNEINIKKDDLCSVKVERGSGAEVNRSTLMISPEIEKRLLSELELESFPTEYRKEILEKCLELIGNNIMIRILNELSDQDSDEFNAFLEKEGVVDSQAIFSFLSTRLPNLDLIIKESFDERLQELKAIYKDLHKDLRAAASEISRINKKYEKQKLMVILISKVVGWLVVTLICYALFKFGIIPIDWVIPKWVQKIFQ